LPIELGDFGRRQFFRCTTAGNYLREQLRNRNASLCGARFQGRRSRVVYFDGALPCRHSVAAFPCCRHGCHKTERLRQAASSPDEANGSGPTTGCATKQSRPAQIWIVSLRSQLSMFTNSPIGSRLSWQQVARMSAAKSGIAVKLASRFRISPVHPGYKTETRRADWQKRNPPIPMSTRWRVTRLRR
jgi:hypothetical protein